METSQKDCYQAPMAEVVELNMQGGILFESTTKGQYEPEQW